MPEPYGYTGGTITLTSGSTAVTGALTAWADLLPGDEIERGGVRGVVDVVVSNTSLTLRAAWGGATYTGTDYVVMYRSSNRHDVSRLSERYARWHRDAAYVINTTGIPDNAIGQDGWMAIDSAAGVSYTKTAGVWGGATPLRLRPLGAYSGATAYLVGDVVSNQSASWVNRTGSTGVAPPTLPTETNTQWQLIAKSGDLTRLNAVAGGDLAAWTGTNSAQIRKATAAEVQTAAGMSAFFQGLVNGGNSQANFLSALGMRLAVGTIADDAVSIIDFGGIAYGLLFVTATSAGTLRPSVYFFRASSTPAALLIAESSAGGAPATGLYTTALAGTTGADGGLNIGVDATGKLYFENRRGFAAAVTAHVFRV